MYCKFTRSKPIAICRVILEVDILLLKKSYSVNKLELIDRGVSIVKIMKNLDHKFQGESDACALRAWRVRELWEDAQDLYQSVLGLIYKQASDFAKYSKTSNFANVIDVVGWIYKVLTWV